MIDSSAITQSLLERLTRSFTSENLILPYYFWSLYNSEIRTRALLLADGVKRQYYQLGGRDLTEALGIPDENIEHLLGHGYGLTRYLIAPILSAEEESDKIGEVGAVLSLLITLYDHGLDDGLIEPITGRQAISGVGQLETIKHGSNFNPLQPIFQLYWSLLRSLPSRGIKELIMDKLVGYFQLMFDEENQTVITRQIHSQELAIVRKSALPGVVFSLPAFIILPNEALNMYDAHLRWSYRVGDFLGILDDAVDIEEDLQKNHPNRIVMRYKVNELATIDCDAISNNVVTLAKRIDREWTSRCSGRNTQPIVSSAALSASIMSWLKIRPYG